MFDAISGKTTSKINPDLVIQADELNTPSETTAFTSLTLPQVIHKQVAQQQQIPIQIQNQHLLKYVRQKDDIIIVGCGNSTVGMNSLLMNLN
uniref:Uncharacterized protein n=1 Tax=Trichogramma kaykai TaxID=54128 RepID=A0ABD2WIE8_9HYME